MKPSLMILGGFAVSLLSTPAAAVVVNIDSHEVRNFTPSYWTANASFNLPVGFTNARLHITSFGADDRGIALLNGALIDSVGLFAPGDGFFTFTQFGPNVPFHYDNGDGARDISITSGFLTGKNDISFIINDTSAGIFGSLTGGPNGRAGGAAYAFNADLGYDLRSGGVPEPASWALMIVGFGLTGGAMRRRRQTVRFAPA